MSHYRISVALAAAASMAITVSARAQVSPVNPGQGQGAPLEAALAIADSLLSVGKVGEAFSRFRQLAAASPGSGLLWQRVGNAAAKSGAFAEALWAFRRATALGAPPSATYGIGAMHARLGQKDSALFWLDSAFKRGYLAMRVFQTDSALTSLRGDSRFADFLVKADRGFAPCRHDANARKFDFWVGEWDVRDTKGQIVGHSVIQKVSGDCALLENWTNLGGGMGKSLNAYNSLMGTWQQYWVGQQGNVTEFRHSEWIAATLVFTARPTGVKGDTLTQRLSFSPISADEVRQHGEQSSDGGTTWTTQYDFRYHRKRP